MDILKCILRTHSRTKCRPFSNKLSHVLWTRLRTKWGAFLDKFSHILQTHLSNKCVLFNLHFQCILRTQLRTKYRPFSDMLSHVLRALSEGLMGTIQEQDQACFRNTFHELMQTIIGYAKAYFVDTLQNLIGAGHLATQ